MAELTLPDGRCVRVSLPDAQIAALRAQGPRTMTVRGQVYGDPSRDEEVSSFAVAGRPVGLGTCGDFFVFVDE